LFGEQVGEQGGNISFVYFSLPLSSCANAVKNLRRPNLPLA
jgi:hypothetical protein